MEKCSACGVVDIPGSGICGACAMEIEHSVTVGQEVTLGDVVQELAKIRELLNAIHVKLNTRDCGELMF